MFWSVLPGSAIGGQTYRIPPINTAEWVLRQFWQSFMEDKFDLENAIQKKAEFSYAIAVMDKIGGCEEENWVGSRYAASMWIYTEAVLCNGQNHMENYNFVKVRSIMEVAKWVCDDALDERVWVSELTMSCQEAKGSFL